MDTFLFTWGAWQSEETEGYEQNWKLQRCSPLSDLESQYTAAAVVVVGSVGACDGDDTVTG